MLSDVGEDAGVAPEHAAHRGAEHGRRHRAPPDGREPRRAEQFRGAVHGEERDARDADAVIRDGTERARSEQPACGDTDVVGGHDDAHRRERVAGLGRARPRRAAHEQPGGRS